jgi:hypothetical protein
MLCERLEGNMNRFAVVIGLVLSTIPPTVALAADSAPTTTPSAPSPSAPAAMAAPFGLEWGLSKEELEAKGVKLMEARTSEGSQRFTATGLSKLVAGIETVVVDLGFDNRLWKVIAASEDYPNDPYGFKVKARYAELNDILVQKYGKGKPTHRTGGSIYDEPQYFLAGIKNGKSWHFTNYSANGLNVELSVRAKDSDTGYWVLIYNNTELEKGYDKAKANHEKSAL